MDRQKPIMSSRAVSLFLHACAASCALLLVACGGGSNAGGAVSGGGPPSVTTPPPSPPPPPPPPPNHAPELGEVNLPQSAVYKHAFNYDLTNGGRAFTDPDGDTLRYDIKLGHDNNWDSDPIRRMVGASAARLTGAPEEVGTTVVTVTVTDPGGLTAFARFTITVDANKAPSAVAPLEDRIVNVGELVDMDASMNGAAFADPEGDVMTYEIALRGAAGLSANG